MPINTAFIDRVLELTNQYRFQNGLAPLKLNPELITSAQSHSQDMALRDYFNHTSPSGSTYDSRARAVGYSAMAMAENIAVGYSTPEAVVQGWINSPGHRANLLDPNYREIGIGYYYLANDTGQVNYGSYWTQVFGSGDTNSATNLPQPRLDFGTLSSSVTPLSSNLDTNHTSDIYKFNLTDTRNINLSLYDISAGDDADLYLYQDMNNNGLVEAGDRLLLSATEGSNVDDSINYRANAGNYLAVVQRYAGSQGMVDYRLDLSATSPRQPSNLLTKERDFGQIALGSIVLTDPARTRSLSQANSVGNEDTVDTYYLNVRSQGDGVKIDVSLTGLSADADVRLIQDFNGNRMVDANEVVASSTVGGTSSDSFSKYLSNYSLIQSKGVFVQVYQYSGNTNYSLNTTLTSVLA